MRGPRCAPYCESLEDRTCPAFTASALGGTLAFTGTDLDDVLVVSVQNGNLWYNANNADSPNTDSHVAIADVSKLMVAGLAGNDKIDLSGLAGITLRPFATIELHGDAGADTLIGSGNTELLFGGPGPDLLEGGAGDDGLDGSDGGVQFDPRALIVAWTGRVDDNDLSADTLRGDDGRDLLIGGAGDDVLQGGAGNDELIGEAGADRLEGGDGDDELIGGIPLYATPGLNFPLNPAGLRDLDPAGNDSLLGEAGNDLLLGGNGANVLDGGAGSDQVKAIPDPGQTILTNDRLAGANIDRLSGVESVTLGEETFSSTADSAVAIDASAFTLGPVTLLGSPADDTLIGGAGADLLDGRAGNDLIFASDTDSVVASAGNDTVVRSAAPPVTQPQPNLPPDVVFVEHLYGDLLGRGSDPGGLAFWTARLAAGEQRQNLISDFLQSPERQARVIDGFYRSWLRRPASPDEVQAWLATRRVGATLEQIEAAVLGSDEYVSTVASGKADGFLAALYSDLLGRPIDESGALGFGNLLATGASRTQVAELILDSQEYHARIVQQLYQALLGRSADADGLAFFTDLLAQTNRLETVEGTILRSAEYFRRASGNASQQFVAKLYRDLLQRKQDPAGIAFWSDLLDTDQRTPRQVAAQILASRDARAVELDRLYQQFLGRGVDPAGLAFYGDELAAGGAQATIQAQVAGSAEFLAVRGGGTPMGFLEGLYQVALGRPVDAAAQASFGVPLSAGLISREEVADRVFQSAEYQGLLVQDLYQRYLGRAAAAAEQASLIDALRQGASVIDVQAGIVGSQEYYRLATRSQ